MSNEKRKEEIFNTAMSLFYEKGFNNVSVMDICDACNITKPTFYKYVPSKEEILRYHYRGTLDELIDMLSSMDQIPDYWRLIVLGLTFTLRKSVQMGLELYGQYMIMNFRSHTLTARYNSPARDSTINSIRKAQEFHQIKNQSDAAELYLAARNVGLGLALKWCMTQGSFDVIEKTTHALETIFEPDHDTIRSQVEEYEQAKKAEAEK